MGLEKMKDFKLIIAGSRDFDDYRLLKDKADNFLKEKAKDHKIIIVSGHARGADSLGEKYAAEKDYTVDLNPADWKRYGRYAGPKRNKEMVKKADALLAFWDGKSKGTKNTINEAKKKGLNVRVVEYKRGI